MAASFQCYSSFFDDKTTHADFPVTVIIYKKNPVLEQYGQAFKALDSGERKPATKEEKNLLHFAVVNVHKKLLRKTWNKYRTCINTTKRA